MTTFEVGAPDWGVRSQLDVVAYNQAIPASPTTLVMDVARWRWSLIQLQGAIGAGGNCNLSATWQDVNGVNVTGAALGAMSCGQSTAQVVGFMRHLGPQVTFTITNGGGGLPTVRIIHTNDAPPYQTVCTPNMGGRQLLFTSQALGIGANVSVPVKGTGGFGTAFGQIYCGPAMLGIEASGGGEAHVNLNGALGKIFEVGFSEAGAGVRTKWAPVTIPPEDWSVTLFNGGVAQTVEAFVAAV